MSDRKGAHVSANLGDKVTDSISGRSGIVIGRTEWLYGCVRLTVQPQEHKDGKPVDPFVVDEPQVSVVKPNVFQRIAESVREPVRRHGPRPDAGRRANPTR